MPPALTSDQHQRASAQAKLVDEIVKHGVLAALHRRGRADHHQPDEQEARYFVEAVDRGGTEEAQHHLQEHRRGHHREDEAADVTQRVVGARERGAAARAPRHRWVRRTPAYLVFRMHVDDLARVLAGRRSVELVVDALGCLPKGTLRPAW